MNKSIGQFMIKSPYVTEPGAGLQDTAEFLAECGIRHLPVVDDGRLVGILSERELRAATCLPQAGRLTIGDIMERDVYVAKRTSPLKEIIRAMQERKLGSTVVVNDANEVQGIFTVTDALGVLFDLLESDDEEELFIGDYFETWDAEAIEAL